MMVNIYFLGVAWETHLLLALCLVRKLLRWVLILKFYWKKKNWYWGKLDLEKPFPLTIPSPHFVCISSLSFSGKIVIHSYPISSSLIIRAHLLKKKCLFTKEYENKSQLLSRQLILASYLETNCKTSLGY
jgi:predicted transporter